MKKRKKQKKINFNKKAFSGGINEMTPGVTALRKRIEEMITTPYEGQKQYFPEEYPIDHSGAGGNMLILGPTINIPSQQGAPQQEAPRKTEEEKKDDLYDCPRGCSARLEWKDLQVHIAAGCEVTATKGNVIATYTLAPLQAMGGTPYGNFVNPDPYNMIEITITTKKPVF